MEQSNPKIEEDSSSAFPPWNFPTIFTDGIGSIAQGGGNVKFYLTRFEPAFAGTGQVRQNLFAQVVMPIQGFIATYVLFETAVNRYVKQGLVKQGDIDKIREAFAKIPEP